MSPNGELNWYDFEARQRDGIVPVFTTMDPRAEKYPWSSPYAYCLNNPVRFIDPNGMEVYYNYTSSTFVDPNGMEAHYLSSTFVDPSGTIIEHRDDKDPTIYIVPDVDNWDGTKEGLLIYGYENILIQYDDHIGENIKDVGYSIVRPVYYDPPLQNVYPEFVLLSAGTKAGWAMLRWLWNQVTSPPGTTNTFDAYKSGFAKGSTKNERKINPKAQEAAQKRIEMLEQQKAGAKTAAEKQVIQNRIKHERLILL